MALSSQVFVSATLSSDRQSGHLSLLRFAQPVPVQVYTLIGRVRCSPDMEVIVLKFAILSIIRTRLHPDAIAWS